MMRLSKHQTLGGMMISYPSQTISLLMQNPPEQYVIKVHFQEPSILNKHCIMYHVIDASLRFQNNSAANKSEYDIIPAEYLYLTKILHIQI